MLVTSRRSTSRAIALVGVQLPVVRSVRVAPLVAMSTSVRRSTSAVSCSGAAGPRPPAGSGRWSRRSLPLTLLLRLQVVRRTGGSALRTSPVVAPTQARTRSAVGSSAGLVGVDRAVAGEDGGVLGQAEGDGGGHPDVGAPDRGAGEGRQVRGPLDGALDDGGDADPLAGQGLHQRRDLASPGGEVGVVEGHGLGAAPDRSEGGGRLCGGAVDDHLAHPVDAGAGADAGAAGGGGVPLAGRLGVGADRGAAGGGPQLAGGGVEQTVVVHRSVVQDVGQDPGGTGRVEVLDLGQQGEGVRDAEGAVLEGGEQPGLGVQLQGRVEPGAAGGGGQVQQAPDLPSDELALLRAAVGVQGQQGTLLGDERDRGGACSSPDCRA